MTEPFAPEVVHLDDLERVVRIGLLYDHYGPLLTAHQCEAIDLYYLRNWSLQEIAEAWSTSRQAVHDLIGRATRLLAEYEVKLSLEAREQRNRAALQTCANQIEEARGELGRDRARAADLLASAAGTLGRLLGDEEPDGR